MRKWRGGERERERQSWMTTLISVSSKHSLVLRGHLVQLLAMRRWWGVGRRRRREKRGGKGGGGAREGRRGRRGGVSALQSTVLPPAAAPPSGDTLLLQWSIESPNGSIFPSRLDKEEDNPLTRRGSVCWFTKCFAVKLKTLRINPGAE